MYKVTTAVPSDTLETRIINDIHLAIQKRVNEVRARILADAVTEFERETQKIVAEVALNLSNYYTIERVGANLLVTVKIDGVK